ncbi:hypothetical protein EDB85DRAFT_1552122 [Lactarius pseudohatsudake]|nr:hypothetical protein EDB85DRAFT_1552122 [Lactarius pseudohatsudake]
MPCQDRTQVEGTLVELRKSVSSKVPVHRPRLRLTRHSSKTPDARVRLLNAPLYFSKFTPTLTRSSGSRLRAPTRRCSASSLVATRLRLHLIVCPASTRVVTPLKPRTQKALCLLDPCLHSHLPSLLLPCFPHSTPSSFRIISFTGHKNALLSTFKRWSHRYRAGSQRTRGGIF